MKARFAVAGTVLVVLALGSGYVSPSISAQVKKSPAAQKTDDEYTKLIKQYLQDPRITTELVDHLPASDTVPTPLKFFGRAVGTPGELTYAKDIYRYYEALAKAAPGRAKYIKVGTTEEGRDIVLLAIADEATLKSLDKYRDMLGALTDPRKTNEAQAQQLLKTAKPIYYVISGMHSPETGGPEMLIELAYRLIVEETPFVQNIRNNVITLITPVIEVDGREKQVDTYYFNKKRAQGDARLPLMYWGKYVQHDNNRDGMGQFLKLTQTVTKETLEWHPTVIHDLHEAQTYLYASTGTGPYNNDIDPIVVGEWWQLAENDVVEMTKRGVPGVWTYGFYDGWVPNYMFFIAHSHNSIGRFYEVQSYGPDPYEVRPGATVTSKEWFRPNPPLASIKWGPRNNTNIQESALLFSLSHVAKNRELYLENYWLKNKRAVEKGKTGPTYAWVIPATQRRKADAADAVNELRQQGLEVSRATTAFKAGNVDVKAGDYVVRGDQPFRTLADMYFSIQNYAPQNPSPYDDTGWTFQYMRDVTILPVTDGSILDSTHPMTLLTADAKAPGGVIDARDARDAGGTGTVLVVDHTADNNIVTFRFRNKDVPMQAAEDDFEIGGHKFRAGAIIVPNVSSGDRAKLEPMLKDLGLSAWAVASAPSVKTHDLDIPRIGYIHSWTRTQDEGWWRAALDTFGVPYTYFADQKVKDGNLRSKYDVIIFPHVGGSAVSQVNGMPMTGRAPLPYKKTAEFPNIGAIDQSDDIRGGMGVEGLVELVKFVQQGGTLITEGSTATIFPEYGLAGGITVEEPAQLFVRGSILRTKITDMKSPIAYGFGSPDLPVYFNQSPVFSAGGGGLGGFGGGGRGGAPGANPNGGLGQNVTPNAVPLRILPFEADANAAPVGRGERPGADDMAQVRQMAAQFGIAIDDTRPRVVMQFSQDASNLLLSGTLANGQLLANHPAALDSTIGKGHVVMFAIRPFWRWQSQGTYTLGFNTIMNWNDLDAGKGPAGGRNTTNQQAR
ncbi:MAG TPA: M14 family zinc carboxypeptidase [Vicinamibacterales bacterium]|nr:M14 family zinc carboxypeptidase [Vicinamibacterales bacterium]